MESINSRNTHQIYLYQYMEHKKIHKNNAYSQHQVHFDALTNKKYKEKICTKTKHVLPENQEKTQVHIGPLLPLAKKKKVIITQAHTSESGSAVVS